MGYDAEEGSPPALDPLFAKVNHPHSLATEGAGQFAQQSVSSVAKDKQTEMPSKARPATLTCEEEGGLGNGEHALRYGG